MTLSKAQLDELRALYYAAPKGTWHMDGDHAYIFEEGQRRYILNPNQPAAKLLVSVMNMLPDLLYGPPRGIWIEHTGDECPVDLDSMVRIKMWSLGEWKSEYLPAGVWSWGRVSHYMLAPDT